MGIARLTELYMAAVVTLLRTPTVPLSPPAFVRAKFANSVLAREITIPNGWTKIRVGIRISGYSATTFTPDFALGFCCNTGSLYGDATTTHFVGVQNTGAFSYSGGWWSSTLRPVKKVNTTSTVGSNMQPIYCVAVGDGYYYPTLFFVDITKTGGTNYAVNAFSGTVGGSATNTKFISTMQMDPPTHLGHGYSAPQTLAVNEAANGTLNAIQVYWNQASYDLDVLDIGWIKLS